MDFYIKNMKSRKNKTQKRAKKILEAEVVARYFGFVREAPGAVTKEDVRSVDGNCREKNYLDDNLFSAEEILAQVRKYRDDEKETIEPKLLYFTGSVTGPHRKHRKSGNNEIINLHMINVSESIAEATLIKTAQAILADAGIKKILVKINDVGDKDSQGAFIREATSYYRKNSDELNTHCRQLFKESLYSLMSRGKNQCLELHKSAPKPMDYLDEDARKKFGETLEFLETLDIFYEIDPMLIGDPNYSTHTVFEIINQEDGSVVAAGSRYDSLARKYGLKKDIPSVGMVIYLPKPKMSSEKILKKVDKARFFFLQISYEAKLKCLSIIDELRHAHLPVLHKIYRDKLSVQIAAAKKTNVDYLIIMGQKEALDDELILRDKENRSQQIVRRADLIGRLKKLK